LAPVARWWRRRAVFALIACLLLIAVGTVHAALSGVASAPPVILTGIDAADDVSAVRASLAQMRASESVAVRFEAKERLASARVAAARAAVGRAVERTRTSIRAEMRAADAARRYAAVAKRAAKRRLAARALRAERLAAGQVIAADRAAVTAEVASAEAARASRAQALAQMQQIEAHARAAAARAASTTASTIASQYSAAARAVEATASVIVRENTSIKRAEAAERTVRKRLRAAEVAAAKAAKRRA